MDINFHYYAVKVLAVKAGFPELEAQRIACISQFVDDFTSSWSFAVDIASVPEDAKCLIVNGKFKPIPTGFTLIEAITRSNRLERIVPFHFIPTKPLTQNMKEEKEPYRVVQGMNGDGSLTCEMLASVLSKLLNATEPAVRSKYLVRLGILAHIFADTFSHEKFSGQNIYTNKAKLTHKGPTGSVGENAEGEQLPISDSEENASLIPPTGHAQVWTWPDHSGMFFGMDYTLEDSKTGHYQRNNTDTFQLCALRIFNFFRRARGKGSFSDTSPEWVPLAAKLRQGFLVPEKFKEKDLLAHWGKIFPEVPAFYDKKIVLDDLIKLDTQDLNEQGCSSEELSEMLFEQTDKERLLKVKHVTPEYYHYNVFAYGIRNAVLNGSPIPV